MLEIFDDLRGAGPLRDVTVLDLSQMMMGPLATQLYGDLGALVVKIERPRVGEWERSYQPFGQESAEDSPFFWSMNRNKISVELDLKSAEDKEIFLELVPECDLLIHNYRQGVMERLGLGYDVLRELNPRIVYAYGSGYGATGPLKEESGQDLLLQAFSGLAAQNGKATDPPVPVATPVVDASSAFLLAFSSAAALLEARRTGIGREVGVSLLGTALQMQCQQAFLLLNNSSEPLPRSSGNIASWWSDAPYGVYEASDGFIAIAMAPRQTVSKLLGVSYEGLNYTELGSDEWVRRRDLVDSEIATAIQKNSISHWKKLFDQSGVWSAPVQGLEAALKHPHLAESGLVYSTDVDGKKYRFVGSGIEMAGLESFVRLPPPVVGSHSDMLRKARKSHD